MASTPAPATHPCDAALRSGTSKDRLFESIRRLCSWLEENDYCGYDTFDGLNARFLRPLTFNSKMLRTVLQQGVRRFPINLRPFLGIPRSRSTKAMGFLARGFIRLHEVKGEEVWADGKHLPGLYGGLLGQPFRLSVAWVLSTERGSNYRVDLTDWACVSGCL